VRGPWFEIAMEKKVIAFAREPEGLVSHTNVGMSSGLISASKTQYDFHMHHVQQGEEVSTTCC